MSRLTQRYEGINHIFESRTNDATVNILPGPNQTLNISGSSSSANEVVISSDSGQTTTLYPTLVTGTGTQPLYTDTTLNFNPVTETLATPALTLTTPLSVSSGGTGESSFTANSLLTSGTSTTNPLTTLTNGNPGTVLSSTGSSTLPAYQTTGRVYISQSAHGFSVGNWLYFNGSTYALAYDTTAATAEVVGIVTSVPDSNHFVLTTCGNYVTGLSGLTAGSVYFLSQTPGAMTTTQETTTGYIDKPLFVADSTTSGYYNSYRGEVVPQSGLVSGTTLSITGSGTIGSSLASSSTSTLVVDGSSTVTSTSPSVLSVEYTGVSGESALNEGAYHGLNIQVQNGITSNASLFMGYDISSSVDGGYISTSRLNSLRTLYLQPRGGAISLGAPTFSTYPNAASYTNTSGYYTTVPTGTYTLVGSWTTASYGNSNFQNGSVGGTVQVLASGYYMITVCLNFPTNTTGYRWITISKNPTVSGTTITSDSALARAEGQAINSDYWFLSTSAIVQLNANDYIGIGAWQNSGTSLSSTPVNMGIMRIL